jgi:hypothetical protein
MQWCRPRPSVVDADAEATMRWFILAVALLLDPAAVLLARGYAGLGAASCGRINGDPCGVEPCQVNPNIGTLRMGGDT